MSIPHIAVYEWKRNNTTSKISIAIPLVRKHPLCMIRVCVQPVWALQHIELPYIGKWNPVPYRAWNRWNQMFEERMFSSQFASQTTTEEWMHLPWTCPSIFLETELFAFRWHPDAPLSACLKVVFEYGKCQHRAPLHVCPQFVPASSSIQIHTTPPFSEPVGSSSSSSSSSSSLGLSYQSQPIEVALDLLPVPTTFEEGTWIALQCSHVQSLQSTTPFDEDEEPTETKEQKKKMSCIEEWKVSYSRVPELLSSFLASPYEQTHLVPWSWKNCLLRPLWMEDTSCMWYALPWSASSLFAADSPRLQLRIHSHISQVTIQAWYVGNEKVG